MASITELKFTEEQKREYKKLRIIAVSVGIIGLILMTILFVLDQHDSANIVVSLLMIFYVYFNHQYIKLLSKSEKTTDYVNFKNKLYSKFYKFWLFPIIAGNVIFVFVILEFSLNPWLIAIYLVGSGIAVGSWAAREEKKKFGSIKKAPK